MKVKVYKINKSGELLIKSIIEFYDTANKIGAVIDEDAIEDDSSIGIASSLEAIEGLGFENGITKNDFEKHIGGNFKSCLPYLELVK